MHMFGPNTRDTLTRTTHAARTPGSSSQLTGSVHLRTTATLLRVTLLLLGCCHGHDGCHRRLGRLTTGQPLVQLRQLRHYDRLNLRGSPPLHHALEQARRLGAVRVGEHRVHALHDLRVLTAAE